MQLEAFESSMNEAFKHNDAEAMRGIFNDELFGRLRTERAASDALSAISDVFKDDKHPQTAIKTCLRVTLAALKMLADHHMAVMKINAARGRSLEHRIGAMETRKAVVFRCIWRRDTEYGLKIVIRTLARLLLCFRVPEISPVTAMIGSCAARIGFAAMSAAFLDTPEMREADEELRRSN